RHGIAHLDGVDAPVPATVARRIGCTGDILRALFSPEGRILELRSIQRCFTPTQRKAIVARDGGCIIPGCTIPAAWCEIHHVQDHAQGGPTETDNGVLLCWWHHHHLDTSGW
ncbi:HNH endonuclease signature motif containing protein, partial [Microbacterium sp. KNMS]